MARKLKAAEHALADLQRRFDEQGAELANALADARSLGAEVARLKVIVTELTDKKEALERENRSLSGELSDIHA